jgi:hypothetical protein
MAQAAVSVTPAAADSVTVFLAAAIPRAGTALLARYTAALWDTSVRDVLDFELVDASDLARSIPVSVDFQRVKRAIMARWPTAQVGATPAASTHAALAPPPPMQLRDAGAVTTTAAPVLDLAPYTAHGIHDAQWLPGAAGVVARASTSGGKHIVIKVTRDGASAAWQSRVLKSVRDANGGAAKGAVVELFDVHEPTDSEARHCLVMEAMDQDLLGYVIPSQPIPWMLALQAFECTLTAIAGFHAAGYAVMDLKPNNALVPRGAFTRVAIGDVDQARAIGDLDNVPAPLLFTELYVAPEVACSRSGELRVTGKEDMFNLGLLGMWLFDRHNRHAFASVEAARRALAGAADPVVDPTVVDTGMSELSRAAYKCLQASCQVLANVHTCAHRPPGVRVRAVAPPAAAQPG